MSRYWKIACLSVLCCLVWRSQAQDAHQDRVKKGLRAFYAIAYSDIYARSMPATMLEKYIAASYGFADKDAIKDILLRDMLFSKPLKSSYDVFFDTLKAGKSGLAKLPAISPDIREVPLKLFLTVVMLDCVNDSGASFIEIANKNDAWAKTISPHKPEFTPTADAAGYIRDYALDIQWALKYPAETAPYQKKIMAAYSKWHAQDSTIRLVDFYAMVTKKFLEYKPFIAGGLPLSLEEYRTSPAQNTPAIPTASQIHERPEFYIEEAFQNLLNRKPTPGELKGYTDIYRSQVDLGAELLYYTIMASDEYAYY